MILPRGRGREGEGKKNCFVSFSQELLLIWEVVVGGTGSPTDNAPFHKFYPSSESSASSFLEQDLAYDWVWNMDKDVCMAYVPTELPLCIPPLLVGGKGKWSGEKRRGGLVVVARAPGGEGGEGRGGRSDWNQSHLGTLFFVLQLVHMTCFPTYHKKIYSPLPPAAIPL